MIKDEKLSVGWISPFPPIKNGISVYSDLLVDYLNKTEMVDVKKISPNKQKNFLSFKKNIKDFDVLVYSIGNHPVHLNSYNLALKESGIIFLHDLNLHDLVYYKSIVEKDQFYYIRALLNDRYSLDDVKKVFYSFGKDRDMFVDFPLLKHIVLSNRYFIVHSNYGKKIVESINGKAKVLKIFHICPWAERVERKKDKDKFIIGIFGFMSKDKLLDRTVSVFKDFIKVSKNKIILRFVGEDVDINLEGIVKNNLPPNSYEIFRNVDDNDFLKLMKGCDYAINIRYPVKGEMSGNLIKFLGFGIPVSIFREKSFEDIPSDSVYPLNINDFETSLLNFFKLIDEKNQIFDQISVKAYNFVKNYCSIEKNSSKIIEFLYEYNPNYEKEDLKRFRKKDFLNILGYKRFIKYELKKLI